FLAGFCLVTAFVGALFVREAEEQVVPPDAVGWTLRDRRLWALCAGSGLLLVAQVAIISFVVLFLHDTHGVSAGAAAGVLAGIQVVAGGMRIGVGRWSDVLGTRALPLRR